MTILPVGFLFYDGTKYVIKSEIDITGPAGPPGPQGPAGVAVGPATGDLGGNYPNPLVVKLQGRSISSSAPSDGQILTWVASNNDWEPQPAPVGFTAGGDLSGTATNQNVLKIHGASVPIAGSLTTGNVLQVTGASTLSYGAVNLAGGSNFVTGTLPTGNQASQTLSGDVTGTTASNTAVTLTGSGGIVTFPIGNILRSTGASNVGDIITTSAGVLTFGSGAGGAVVVQSIGSGGYVKINAPTSGTIYMDANTQNIRDGVGNQYFTFDLASPSLKLDSASGTFPAAGFIRTKNYGSAQVLWSGRSPSTDGPLVTQAATVITIGDGAAWDVVVKGYSMRVQAVGTGLIELDAATATTFNNAAGTEYARVVISTAAEFKFSVNATASTRVWQADLTTNGGTGAPLTIQAQNETGTTSVGGNLVLTSGTGTSTNGSTILQVGGTAKLTLAATTSILTSLNNTLIQSGSAKISLDGASGTSALTSLTSIGMASTTGASTDAFTIVLNDTGATQLNFSVGVTPTIKQNDLTTNSGTGATLTIQAQNETGTTSVGGNLALSAGTGTSTNGVIQLLSNVTMPIGNKLISTGGSNVGDIITTSAGSLIFGNQSAATNVGLYFVNSTSIFSSAAAAQLGLLATGAGAFVKTASETVRLLKADNSTEMFRFDTVTGFLAIGSSPATTGSIRLAQTGSIYQNDGGNNRAVYVGAADQLNFGDFATSTVVFKGGNAYLEGLNGTGYLATKAAGGIVANTNDFQISNAEGSGRALSISPIWNGATTLYFGASVTIPTINQSQAASGNGVDLTLAAQASFGTGVTNGGNLTLRGGANNSTGLKGGVRVQLNGTTTTMFETTEVIAGNRVTALNRAANLTSTEMPANTGDLVTFVGDTATAPTANAVSGGILYSESGAGKWRGSSGTISTFGPAEPHCSVCGSDFVTEHESSIYGYLSVCLKCLSDYLGEQPWIRRNK